MEKQSDSDTLFRVHYSYYLEHMNSTLNRNIFNFLSMVQVVLGGTVMADLSKTFVLGLVIAVLSAILFIYKPGEIAGRSKQQAKRYESLLNTATVNESEVLAQLSVLKEFDSHIPGSLISSAWIRAAIASGSPRSEITSAIAELSWYARAVTFIAGGIPR
jgi:hypothetical protein